jgi:hypothetical protein
MPPSGKLRHVALVRTDGSEERSATIIRVTSIGELRTTLVVTSYQRTLLRNTMYVYYVCSVSSQRSSVARYG